MNQKEKIQEDLINRYGTPTEVSKITGLAEQTLANQRFRGEGIPYRKVGRAVRYFLPEVYAFMDRHRVNVKP